jgi:hypothetical protein
MIRVAIIPGGWCGFVLADEARPLIVESFQVGTVQGQQRIITDQDSAAAAARLVGQCASAEEVVINWPAAKDSPNHALAAAIFEAFRSRGTAVRYLSRWRRFYMQPKHRAWRQERLAAFTHWPESGRFDVCKDAGAMLLEAVAPSKERRPLPSEAGGPELVAPDPSYDSIRVTIANEAKANYEAHNIDAGSDEPPGLTTDKPPALPASQPPDPSTFDPLDIATDPAGPPMPPDPLVVAGIDPGSGKVGLCIARGSCWPLTPLKVATYRASVRVPLARPRKCKRRDGTEYTLTTRESLTPEIVTALAASIVAQLRAHGVTRLAIEHVDLVHMPDTATLGAASSIASGMVRSTWIEIEIAAACRAAGIAVDQVTVQQARGAVAGRRAKGQVGTAHISAAIARGFAGWPAADGHARDAGVLAMWLTRPAESAPVARARARKGAKDPRLPGQKAPSYYAGKERAKRERADRRAEAGCTCSGKKHARTCPLARVGDWRGRIVDAAQAALDNAIVAAADDLALAKLKNARDVAALAVKRAAEHKAMTSRGRMRAYADRWLKEHARKTG